MVSTGPSASSLSPAQKPAQIPVRLSSTSRRCADELTHPGAAAPLLWPPRLPWGREGEGFCCRRVAGAAAPPCRMESFASDRKPADCVLSAAKTLGKQTAFGKASLRRVLFLGHSAKQTFAECHKTCTRQTITCAVHVARP